MISIKDIRTNSHNIKKTLKSKGYEGSINDIITIDENFRKLIHRIETLRAQKNNVSEEVAEAKRTGVDTQNKIKEMRTLGDEIKSLEISSNELKLKLISNLEEIPNIPDSSVPIGIDENDNVIVREWGEKRVFNFKEQSHLGLGKSLNLIDMERGAKIAGSGFPLYTRNGAKLERSLISFMLDHHVSNGYSELFPPFKTSTPCINSNNLFFVLFNS